MVWKTSYNVGLGQPVFTLAGIDTVSRVAIGTTTRGFDDLLGEGEFIYLPGVAGLLAGDHVVYDLLPGGVTVTRTTAGAQANTGQSSGVAMGAIPAGSYGWYQISGIATVNAIAGSAAGKAYLSATAGSLSSVATAGSQLIGARLSSAVGVPAAGQAYITMSRPSVQSQIT